MQIGNFLDWKGLSNVHTLICLHKTKFYWFEMKIKKFLLPIWWYNRGLFPLGNKYFGVFVLNGLRKRALDICILLSLLVPVNNLILGGPLKTLFNIVEAPFKKLLNCDVCVVWWYPDGPLNSQEYKSIEIYAVSIKISMNEYHRWINNLVDHLF